MVPQGLTRSSEASHLINLEQERTGARLVKRGREILQCITGVRQMCFYACGASDRETAWTFGAFP